VTARGPTLSERPEDPDNANPARQPVFQHVLGRSENATGRHLVPRGTHHSPRIRDCNFKGVTSGPEETSDDGVTTDEAQEPMALSAADEQLLRELTERARAGDRDGHPARPRGRAG
jgi:hypothetical protein